MASRRLRPMISSLLRSHRANVFLEILWYAQLLGNHSQIGKFQYEQFEPAPFKGDPGFRRVAAPLAPFDNAAAESLMIDPGTDIEAGGRDLLWRQLAVAVIDVRLVRRRAQNPRRSILGRDSPD